MSILSLKNQKEFDHVNKHGSKVHGTYFILVVSTKVPRADLPYVDLIIPNLTMFGMKVSRKFSKKAVVRNKAKRRIRHLVQLLVKNPDLNTNNKAIIVIPKKGFDTSNFLKLSNDFFRAFTESC